MVVYIASEQFYEQTACKLILNSVLLGYICLRLDNYDRCACLDELFCVVELAFQRKTHL